jgi:tyrosine-protein kinase Etk/Wzc
MTQRKDVQSERELDLVDAIDTLWGEWRLIAITILTVLALALAYAFLARPTYRSDLLVQIENSGDRTATGLLGDLSSIFEVKSTGDAEIEVLRSRTILGEAVESVHYDIDIERSHFPLTGNLMSDARVDELPTVERFDVPSALEGRDGMDFTVTILDGGRYRVSADAMPNDLLVTVGETGRIAIDPGELVIKLVAANASPGERFRLRKLRRGEVIATLQKKLQIAEKGKQSGVLSIVLESTQPARAGGLLNAIGAAYVRRNGERKSEEAHKSLDFLEAQLPGLKQQLRDSEDALLAFRNAHGALDLGEEARLDLGQVVALQTRVSLLRQERLAQIQQLMPAHPAIVIIDAQIGAIRRELDTIQERIKTLPHVEQELVRLMRDVKVNNELYLAMVNGMQQLRLARAGNVANVRVLDMATVPEDPARPMRALIVTAALFGGLMLGTCLAFMRRLLFGGVTNPNDLEALLEVPVYALVPTSDRQRKRDRRKDLKPRLLAMTDPQEPAVESLRSMRMALQLALLEAGGNVVLLTGPTAGIGKSFVSTNLAALFASDGKRVLLIDSDLRKGALDRRLALANEIGFSSVLTGAVTLAKAIQGTGIPLFDALTTGPKPAQPTELLQSAALETLLAAAAEAYDLVLIDSAPLLPVTDSLLLARRATMNVIVARYGTTREGELIEVRKRLDRVGARVDGVLLNAMRYSVNGTRYGYGTYGSYASKFA